MLLSPACSMQHFIKPPEKVHGTELRRHRGNFDSYMNVPRAIHYIISWWIGNIATCYKHIPLNLTHITIYTDALLQMYGAYDATNDSGTQGFWSTADQSLRINMLEMKACEIGIHTFCKELKNVHVRLYTDNTTSCSYIHNYGGRFQTLMKLHQDFGFGA